MGKVAITEYEHVTGLYEPVENTFYYLYCDQCGSFNIDNVYPHRRIDSTLNAIAVFSFVAAVIFGLISRNVIVCLGISLIGLLAFLVSGWGGHMKCMRCGNDKITSGNVLHYSEDNLPVDVPGGAIKKEHIRSIARS